MESVLEIKDLAVSFHVQAGEVQAVRGVSLCVGAGEILAVVGESGCGKSVTAQSALGLNRGADIRGSVSLCGMDMTNESLCKQARGKLASMVFQDSMTALNPTMRVGLQITEGLLRGGEMTREACAAEAARLLELVCIPAARTRQYPHEFSGGMRQRVMIAMALASKPRLIIADEPTTALDVTTQLEILYLFARVRREQGTAILIITHNLGVVAQLADRVAVMYAGKVVEEGAAAALLTRPLHPYTAGLLQSYPAPDTTGPLTSIPGTPPDLFAPPTGCAFAPRCSSAMRVCRRLQPPMFPVADGRQAACWLHHADCPEKEAHVWKNY